MSKYLYQETKVTNNEVLYKITGRLNCGNACYYFVRKSLLLFVFYRALDIKLWATNSCQFPMQVPIEILCGERQKFLMSNFMFEFPCIISLYYIKNQQDATLAVLFISNCKITLHVSDAFCVHH